MAKTGKRRKWLVGLLTLLVAGGIVAGFLYWKRPLLQRAALLKEEPDTDDKAWLPDHRRWLTVGETEDQGADRSFPSVPRVLLHSEDRPDIKGKPIVAPAAIRSIQGVTPDCRMIASDWPNGNGKQIALYEMGISSNLTPERHVTFHTPPQATLVEMALSPQGDRMAWLFAYDQTIPFFAVLSKILPGLKKNTHGTGLWVSRWDGKELHEIGYQQSEEKDRVLFNVQGVHWMPDGRRIRFTYRNTNFAVPAQ